MNVAKIRKFCRPFRIVLGIVLIIAAYLTGIKWLYLGVVPLIVGLLDICPLCTITKQCDPFSKLRQKG